MKSKSIPFDELENYIYQINRHVSISIAFEENEEALFKYERINALLADAIKVCRE